MYLWFHFFKLKFLTTWHFIFSINNECNFAFLKVATQFPTSFVENHFDFLDMSLYATHIPVYSRLR